MTAPNRPRIRLATPLGCDQRAVARLTETLQRGALGGGGPYWRSACHQLARLTGMPFVGLTTSGTAALEVGALALALEPDAEVIVPSFAFVTTASAFARQGARLRFADMDPRTLNLDPASVCEQITVHTRAIVAVHYAGVACDLDRLTRLAAAGGAALIEDNAHGLGGFYHGRPLGSFGQFATLSFDWAKNVTCGEGGAVITADAELWRRIEVVRDRGTNRQEFLRGERDRYEWTAVGTNSDLPELSAAILSLELERLAAIQRRRGEIWAQHQESLAAWAHKHEVSLPFVPGECSPAFHIYYLLLPDPAGVPSFIAHLAEFEIESAFHYQPLHLTPFGRAIGGRVGQYPVTEDLAARLVRVPCHQSLSSADLDRIHEAITSFRP